jgi:hypothetical protein
LAIAEPMMAPAASPPTTPAATPQPLQCACAEDGNAAARVLAAASAMIVCFMGVLSGRLLIWPGSSTQIRYAIFKGR